MPGGNRRHEVKISSRHEGGENALDLIWVESEGGPTIVVEASLQVVGGGLFSSRGACDLTLLDALALRWGLEQGPGTKTVWCELQGGDRTSPGEHSAVIRVDSEGTSMAVIAR